VTGAPALLARLARRAAGWPALLRDIAAASLALASLCLGEALAMVLPLPPEALFALPGAVLAWLLLGAPSAAFALLCAALAACLVAAGRGEGLAGPGVEEPLALLAMAAALVTVCAAARWRAKREARRTALLLDACAGDAVSRIAAAEARLAAAEADLAAARRAATRRAPARPAPEDPFDTARRSEGGI
jgi:hypothetical protein